MGHCKVSKTTKKVQPGANIRSIPKAIQPSDEMIQIAEARHHDAFSILGRHNTDDLTTITVYAPYAETIHLDTKKGPAFHRVPETDFFQYQTTEDIIPQHYQLATMDKDGNEHLTHDPYDFGAVLPEFDQHLFSSGNHWHIYKKLGAHLHTTDSVHGVHFAVWAPNAQRVSVVGDFNRWDGRCNPMRSLSSSGIWEIFIPGYAEGCQYKFEILNRDTQQTHTKTDRAYWKS